ncbi:MAG: radical SAM family heme chaperone HemW [Clostridia bacterium]|nr:radical SAM family heme chaperone HemW [Clostridia bacterium]
MTEPIGIYLHIPFCLSRCLYCDFVSSTGDDGELSAYVDRLILEINSFDTAGARVKVDSIFFGGGTPSRLSSSQLGRILDAIRAKFEVLADCETTVEVNPATYSEGYFDRLHRLGVNRLSIGLQSIHENELRALGRRHTYSDFLECFASARQAGFDNISVDIMLGITHQTEASLDATLGELIRLAPEHISAYMLIIEEGTPFADMKDTLALPSEAQERKMYFDTDDRLFLADYCHYEVSNFSKRGYESRHNLKYWTLTDYIGFGPSAHSCYLGKRFYNTSDIHAYMTEDFGNIRFTECDGAYGEDEYIMLKLRTVYGFEFEDFRRRFGYDFREGREDELSDLELFQLAFITDRGITLTPQGFFLSNSAIVKLLK